MGLEDAYERRSPLYGPRKGSAKLAVMMRAMAQATQFETTRARTVSFFPLTMLHKSKARRGMRRMGGEAGEALGGEAGKGRGRAHIPVGGIAQRNARPVQCRDAAHGHEAAQLAPWTAATE